MTSAEHLEGAHEPCTSCRSVRSFLIALLIVSAAAFVAARAAQTPTPPGDPLIAGFKSTYAASVSDAVELVTGKNGTMRYDMKLMTGTNLVGRAVTSLARPAPAEQATPALSVKHSVEIIDEAKPGEVGVIVMEGTLDIAAMGNLMATAAVERGMAGMVLDGAIRDLWDVRRMGLTVYARSKSPRTAVGHYATVAKNVPVECAGVTVRPGDIIVADEDGVVVVPQEHAAQGPQGGAGHRRSRARHVSVHSRVQIAAEGDRQVQPHLMRCCILEPSRSAQPSPNDTYLNSNGARSRR